MGPLPEVPRYLGHLSAPSQEPAFRGCPPAGLLFMIEKAQRPNPRGHQLNMVPGAGQTSILSLSTYPPLLSKRGALQMCDSVPAPDNNCGGGLQGASQRPARRAAQRATMFEVPDVSFKKVRTTLKD